MHTLRFRILRVTRYTGRWLWNGKVVAGHRAQFQAKRDERATAAARRWKKRGT